MLLATYPAGNLGTSRTSTDKHWSQARLSNACNAGLRFAARTSKRRRRRRCVTCASPQRPLHRCRSECGRVNRDEIRRTSQEPHACRSMAFRRRLKNKKPPEGWELIEEVVDDFELQACSPLASVRSSCSCACSNVQRWHNVMLMQRAGQGGVGGGGVPGLTAGRTASSTAPSNITDTGDGRGDGL